MKQMRIKHNETGRSMVEMLGVLAIMGVLSIGGVAGYRYAVDKMNANEIINELKKRAITASQQRVLGQNVNLAEYGNILGKYAVDIPADGYPNNPSAFALEVKGIPEGVCNHILKSDWALPVEKKVGGTVVNNDTSCSDGANILTFAFNNTLGSGDAGNAETPELTTEVTSEVTDVTEPDETATETESTVSETEITDTESISEPEVSVSEEDDRCGEHGTWCGWFCKCDTGWDGDDCSIDATCSGHGTWNGPYCGSVCTCNTGWTGTYCDTSTCNGHGTWNASTKTCTCSTGWTGTYCETEPDCGEHGTWCGSRCSCDAGWTGIYCDIAPCSGNGTWNGSGYCGGECTCNSGWYGDDCSINTPDDRCSGHGIWEDPGCGGRCVCSGGWTGDDCSETPKICSQYNSNDCLKCSDSWGYIEASDCSVCDSSGYKWVRRQLYNECGPCSAVSDYEDNIRSVCSECNLGVDWESCQYSMCRCSDTSKDIGTKPNS